MIERNGKKYYTKKEMLMKGEKLIRKNADKLVLELRKRRAEKFKSGTEIIFSNEGELCIK